MRHVVTFLVAFLLLASAAHADAVIVPISNGYFADNLSCWNPVPLAGSPTAERVALGNSFALHHAAQSDYAWNASQWEGTGGASYDEAVSRILTFHDTADQNPATAIYTTAESRWLVFRAAATSNSADDPSYGLGYRTYLSISYETDTGAQTIFAPIRTADLNLKLYEYELTGLKSSGLAEVRIGLFTDSELSQGAGTAHTEGQDALQVKSEAYATGFYLIPEPASLAILLAGGGWILRRKKR